MTGIACSVLVDAGGLSGGVSSADASTSDATLDGSPHDAGGRFCSGLTPRPFFCSDFDGTGEDGSASAEWPSRSLASGTTLSLDSLRFSSAPHALHAVTTSGHDVTVDLVVPAANAGWTIDLDFELLHPPPDQPSELSVLSVDQVSQNEIFFYMNSDHSYIQNNGAKGAQYSPHLPAVSPDTWHHLSVSLQISATSSIATGTLDGTVVTIPLDSPWTTKDGVTISAGLPNLWQLPSAEALIDNVVVAIE
jgi:hypothetical protein